MVQIKNFRLPLAIALAGVASIGVWLAAHRTAAPAPKAGAYVDARQCAGCHPKIAQTYRHTGMARSFYRPAPENTPLDNFQPFHHRASDTWYSVVRRDGRYYQRRWRFGDRGAESDVEESAMDYVMGSGNHVRTYLKRTPPGALIELPLAWYAESGGHWAMNPGYDTDHAIAPRKVAYGCMFCHNAYPRIPAGHEAAGSDPVYTDPLPEGIDCQRCHGPGAIHAAMAQKPGARAEDIRAGILNPARLSAGRQLEVCMQCHLETTSFRFTNMIKRYGRGPFDYTPAEPLAAAMLFFDHAPGSGHDEKFEIVGSAYRLRQSRCFRESRGKLTCLTCHDPHDVPHGDDAARHYDAACRACHAGDLGARHPAAAANCASCHMPKRRTEDVVHAVMTDHKIQRQPPPNPLASLAERHETELTGYRGEVVPYYPDPLPPTGENALYAAVAQVEQKNNLEVGIPRLQAEIEKQKPQRAEFYVELGRALEDTGQTDKSVAAYESAVRVAPSSALALRRLGVASRSAETLNRAIQAAPDDPKGWYELGLVESDRGHRQESIAAFRKSLELDPDLDRAHNSLGGVLAETGDAEGAEQAFRAALRLNPGAQETLANLATLLATKGDLTQAVYLFERAFRRPSQDATAHTNYGVTLAKLNRFEEAQRQLEAAIRIKPDLAEAHDVLGSLLERKGRVDDAIRHYIEAVKLRPDFSRAQLNLGAALANRGDTAAAIEHVKAAAASSDPAIRQQAGELLAQLLHGRTLP
jgi:tetratricopeptide (TPR) repeat protein